MAYQRWFKTVRDQQGNAINGASCTVYGVGTSTLATVYDPNSDDASPSPQANPFTTTSNGRFGFMAADGEYDVQISGGNGATQQYRVMLNSAGATIYADLAATTGAGLVGDLAPYTGAVARSQHDKNSDVISARDTGCVLDGVADDTAKFEDAASAAAAQGVPLFLAGTSIKLTNADAQGADIIGSGTVVSGVVKNYRSLKGVTLGGVDVDSRDVSPIWRPDTTNKLLKASTANKWFIFTENQTSGYTLWTFLNNETTYSQSLATTASDITGWRISNIQLAVEVLVGYQAESNHSGTWSSLTLSNGVPTHTSGSAYTYLTTTTASAWKEFTVTVPEDGWFSVTFLRSAGSTTSCTVSVDGVAIDSTFSLVATADRWTKEYRTTPGSHVIRVAKNTADATSLHIIGVNFSKLKNARTDVSRDTYGYYRNTTLFPDPCTQSSSNTYAMYDTDAAKWGGGYHGGETGITTTVLLDGVATAISSGDLKVAKGFAINQSLSIDWSGSGGGTLAVVSSYGFSSGQCHFDQSFTGSINSSSFFTTLCGVAEGYTKTVYPSSKTITDTADGSYLPVGKTNRCTYLEPTTGMRFTIDHTTFANEQNTYSGSQIWRVVGSYHKYYYGPVIGGQRNIQSVAAGVTYTTE